MTWIGHFCYSPGGIWESLGRCQVQQTLDDVDMRLGRLAWAPSLIRCSLGGCCVDVIGIYSSHTLGS